MVDVVSKYEDDARKADEWLSCSDYDIAHFNECSEEGNCK